MQLAPADASAQHPSSLPTPTGPSWFVRALPPAPASRRRNALALEVVGGLSNAQGTPTVPQQKEGWSGTGQSARRRSNGCGKSFNRAGPAKRRSESAIYLQNNGAERPNRQKDGIRKNDPKLAKRSKLGAHGDRPILLGRVRVGPGFPPPRGPRAFSWASERRPRKGPALISRG